MEGGRYHRGHKRQHNCEHYIVDARRRMEMRRTADEQPAGIWHSDLFFSHL
jgi:hypothetical protein